MSNEQNLHTLDKGQTKQKVADVCLCYCWRLEEESENEKCEHGKVNEASLFQTRQQ